MNLRAASFPADQRILKPISPHTAKLTNTGAPEGLERGSNLRCKGGGGEWKWAVGSGGPSTGLFCLHPSVKTSNRPSLRQLPVPEHQATADSREGDPVSRSQPRAALGRLQQEELGGTTAF